MSALNLYAVDVETFFYSVVALRCLSTINLMLFQVYDTDLASSKTAVTNTAYYKWFKVRVWLVFHLNAVTTQRHTPLQDGKAHGGHMSHVHALVDPFFTWCALYPHLNGSRCLTTPPPPAGLEISGTPTTASFGTATHLLTSLHRSKRTPSTPPKAITTSTNSAEIARSLGAVGSWRRSSRRSAARHPHHSMPPQLPPTAQPTRRRSLGRSVGARPRPSPLSSSPTRRTYGVISSSGATV